ncbi:hypothetical protein AURDEDRAFT_124309 [Auricularia subglabra TFB-10046 SS5]|nr:hypothetical protein AURDEDRAFT_124309 [Auricularia subglabra TFB-10046 SS5]
MGLSVLPLDAAKALVKWTAAGSDGYTPLKSAAGAVAWLIQHLEEVQAVQKEYLELERLIREFLDILIAAGRQRKGGFTPIPGLDSAAGAVDDGESDGGSSITSVPIKEFTNSTPVRFSKAVKKAIQEIDRYSTAKTSVANLTYTFIGFSILKEIKKFFEGKMKNGKVQPKRSFWARIFTKDRDASRLKSLDKRLRDALEMFKTRGQITQERAMRQTAQKMKEILAEVKAQRQGVNPSRTPPVATIPVKQAVQAVVVQTATIPERPIHTNDLLGKQKILFDDEIKRIMQELRDAERERVESIKFIIDKLGDMETRVLAVEDITARMEALESRIVEGESTRKQELDAWKKTLRYIHEEHHAWAELQKLPQQIAEQLIDRFSSGRKVPIEGPEEDADSGAPEHGAYLSPPQEPSPVPMAASPAPSSAPSWTFP